ncbi:glycerophosphodiester phosphodiesterase [Streptomyces sp. H27-D2]|uniref:glycerophosphodiester phosphodiesterase n=1 Tax=Streptomyces sp. H27-D2 TaxID=3046304 RepID=UPI002DBE2BEB|nr:glycerophosphodiester phosphodiesterase family protein [Streptomyces sp. H27-D2]MEC4017814.1 glycerophosphodiester phosphodiesterase family protein [Streptomyces sp. H27-D2]
MAKKPLITGALTLALLVAGAAPAVPTAPETAAAARTPVFLARHPVTAGALPPVTYTAHRGGALEAPENSMSGLAAAFASRTAQVLDFDTRMLRDGTLVVMHDATLDRTTDRTGPVRALTARQWKAVRLRPGVLRRGKGGAAGAVGGSKGGSGPGHGKRDKAHHRKGHPRRAEHPPTVAQVLDRFGGRSVLLLEAKDPSSIHKLARLIRARHLTESVFVNTNHPWLARVANRMGLLAQLWRSARQLRGDRPEDWRTFVTTLDVDYRARARDLRRAVASGIPRVWAHTVNTVKDRDRVLRLGCDGIITDAPRLLRAALPTVR